MIFVKKARAIGLSNLFRRLFHSHRELVFNFPTENITTKLSDDYNPIDKYLHTNDWGSFKFRKNGRIRLMVGGELIRCTPVPTDRKTLYV